MPKRREGRHLPEGTQRVVANVWVEDPAPDPQMVEVGRGVGSLPALVKPQAYVDPSPSVLRSCWIKYRILSNSNVSAKVCPESFMGYTYAKSYPSFF